MTKTEWVVAILEVSGGRVNLKGLSLMLQAGQIDLWRSLGRGLRRPSLLERRFGVSIDLDQVSITCISTLRLKEDCSIETSATVAGEKIVFYQLIMNGKGEHVATSETSYLVRDKESGVPRMPEELKAAIAATINETLEQKVELQAN